MTIVILLGAGVVIWFGTVAICVALESNRGAGAGTETRTEVSLEALNVARLAAQRIVDQKFPTLKIEVTRDALRVWAEGEIAPSQVEAIKSVVREHSIGVQYLECVQGFPLQSQKIRGSLQSSGGGLPPAPPARNGRDLG